MQATFPAHGTSHAPLCRPHQGRMIAGVAAGLAEHFDVDVAVVRVGLVVLTLFGALGVPLYLAAWLFVPDECDDESVAEHLLGYGCPGQVRGPGPYGSATAMASAPARAGAPRAAQADPGPATPPAPHAGAEPDARRSHDAAPS
jgi:phage shock protein PspC (stress-responsive transcriptional regulator)